MKINFILICEGSSDSSLVEHLESLLIECGATEVSGDCPDLSRLPNPPGKVVRDMVNAAIKLNPIADIIFIHRDADNAGIEDRLNEIVEHTAHIVDKKIIPIIPNRMTEAWLLLDEEKLKISAGNAGYNKDLHLPSPITVEKIANPKDFLFNKLREVSELTGRKLERFNKDIYKCRRYLIENLSTDSKVNQVPSYQNLKNKLQEVIFID
ncbi:TPA: hypothetical protein ACSPZW_001751 [Aeromonas hydrophila]|uniref:hypothetical protein n=1 Tax=Aeromonas hydrophila TaxID=644 RepID=UPI00191EB9EF|nr:hypothetical protein [Aeromonas hydrophila]MBL0570254.1 hypothetical protein [Aeromonas hydrophila]